MGRQETKVYKLQVFGEHVKGRNYVDEGSLGRTRDACQASSSGACRPLSRLTPLKGPFCPCDHLALVAFAVRLISGDHLAEVGTGKTSILRSSERRLSLHGTNLTRYSVILQVKGLHEIMMSN